MSEKNIKPSTIVSINKLFLDLNNMGLSSKDIYLLIQARTKPKLPIRDIKNSIQATIRLERCLHYYFEKKGVIKK